MMDYPLTLTALLGHAERTHGAREVVSRRPDRSLHRYSYGECIERARRLATALRRLGLEPGDRVATFCWNHSRHLEAYYGIPASGFVLHTLNIRLHADELGYIATHAGDRVAIVDKVLWPAFEAFAGKAPFEHVIVVTEDGIVPDGTIDYDTFLASAEPEPFVGPTDENAAAAMCYTSGTTGKPKGVLYSHRSQVLHSLAIALPDAYGMSAADTVLPVVPMFHANAWGIPAAAAMVGAKLVLPGPFLDAESLVQLLAGERATLTAGVTTIWMGILQYLDANRGRYDLSVLRRMLIGGSAVPESMIRAFDERHHLHIVQAWGMTETSPLGSINGPRAELVEAPPDERYASWAKQGLPSVFVDIRARNADGLVPWDGQTMGELEVRGPWVVAAYHDDATSADKFTDDGWFLTGDIVTIGRNGRISVQDRSKDLVKSGGEWISSVLLETALMGHPEVAEAAVVAVAHPKWAERPLALIVPKAGCCPDPASLSRHLAPAFPRWWLPDSYVAVASLPRTATGKLKKTELRETYREHYADGLATPRPDIPPATTSTTV